MLNIGYFADGKWGQDALRYIVGMPDVTVQFVCVRYDTPDMALSEIAGEYNIPVLKYPDINSNVFFQLIEKYPTDLFVSMSFDQIFKEKTIHYPKMKTINCHAGKLPFYRGRNILNWVLINDEKEFGITVHYMDSGIDTGDIILQRTYEISDEDTYETLLETAYRECPLLLIEAIQQIQSGTVQRIKQSSIHPVGLYCGRRIPGDEVLKWNQSSRKIFNFVRAICRPGPMARTSVLRNGSQMEIKINRVEMISGAVDYIGIPGQVLYKDGASLVVKTADSSIRIVEYEAEQSIKVGDRLQ